MREDKTSKLINEICSYSLQSYNESIGLIVRKILEVGARITVWETSEKSEYSPHEKRIFLGVKNRAEALHIVWSLLHEFGHHIDEIGKFGNKNDVEMGRERRAWAYADIEVKNYSDLMSEITSYKLRKEYCLNRYAKRNGLPHQE